MAYNITAAEAANFQALVNASQGRLDNLVSLEMLQALFPSLSSKFQNMNSLSDLFRGFAQEGLEYNLEQKNEMYTLLANLIIPLMTPGTLNSAEVIFPIIEVLQNTFELSHSERAALNRISNEEHCITF